MTDSAGSNVVDLPGREQPVQGRVYGGLTAEQRTAARRERLIDAGIEVFGTEGYKTATVRQVIKTSGLGERYFYENFEDLDDLMISVAERIHEQIMHETLLAVTAAGDDPREQAKAGLTTFIKAMTRDPRKARIKLLEMNGAGDKVKERRREGMNQMATFIAATAPEDIKAETDMDPRLIALGLVGAVNELLIEWFLGEIDGGVDQLVDHCTALFDAVLSTAYANQSTQGTPQ